MSDRDTSENKPVITDPSFEFDMFELIRTRLVDALTASGYNSLEAERIAFFTTNGVRSVPLFMKALTRIEAPGRDEIVEALGRILDETAGLEKAKRLLLHQGELQQDEVKGSEESEEKPKHRIEIFSAGCPLCQKAIDRVYQIADSSCEIEVVDMNQQRAQAQAELYGITHVPAVVVDGVLSNLTTKQEDKDQE